MTVKINILDFMVNAGLKPIKMVLPKEQWEALWFQLSQMQRFSDHPMTEPEGIYEDKLIYRDIEIEKEKEQ